MEFQLSYFKSWNMVLLKCWTQYVRKFGKLNSGHRTGKSQLSFQSQRKAMPKNVWTMIQLHLFHILARLFPKSFKLGLSCMWTEKFQMYKLGFEEAKQSEIKLPTFTGSWRKQGNFSKISTSASLTLPKPMTVWIITNYGKFLNSWENQTTLPASWETSIQVKKQQSELDIQLTFSKCGKEYDKAVYCYPAYLIYMQSISCDWMNTKLESRLPGDISTTSDM